MRIGQLLTIRHRNRTMNATNDTIEATVEGRDVKGRFAKGNKGGPGNPFARKVAQLRAALVNFVTEDDMKHLAFVLKMRAEGGDMQAMKLLFQYVLGKPAETVDPDRLDVDEWQKMREQSRPPEEATKVLGGLPAQTVCEVTKVAWPCAAEQAFKQPVMAGLKRMDERDARERSSQAHGRQSVGLQAEAPPSTKGDNGRRGEPAPSTNGRVEVSEEHFPRGVQTCAMGLSDAACHPGDPRVPSSDSGNAANL
jgi:hypothetical protein